MLPPSSWNLRTAGNVEYYELDAGPNLLIAFTTRTTGASSGPFASLNLSPEAGDRQRTVDENREMVKRAFRIPALVTMRQTHSDIVLPIFYSKTPADLLEGDAAFTNLPGLALGIEVADCLPVYTYSVQRPVAGIAHCGWRGTASRIAEKLARSISRRFAVPLTDLRFALGPCICPDCYVVGEDVVRRFKEAFPAAERFFRRGKTCCLDIRAANRWLLLGMGLTESASLDLCTRENNKYFYSARRETPTGRNLALIAVR